MALLTTSTLPPGGWRYKQFRPDGSVFKFFRAMGGFETFCKSILSIRTDNGFLRATQDEVSADVQDYICHDLGNDPRYCFPVGPNGQPPPPKPAKKAAGCGCCGGRKA